ncbi:hypothetical protein R3X27_20715 [Tropicimonas sp. TH_r6]|uniref:hypothetical protein n=1 Tax=Tropicimonas sp. TH_r6 TaxID=3082085 RepID=UPI002954AB54|nr:hypothetical protein [Tropicimonas sp. TH_r6]MDV7145111.1 hypothetical protein [Tropicimonas sp. TH_r6]
MRRKAPALLSCCVLALSGCVKSEPIGASVPSRGPGPSYTCLAPALTVAGMRQRTQPTASGWRMRVEVMSGPPAGWYDKGQIEYEHGLLSYVPNTATTGIAEERVTKTLLPLIRSCADARGKREWSISR